MNSQRITRIALMLSLLIICSYISIPIGHVPISLQTMAIFIIGLLLSPQDAAITTSLYLIMGVMGVPVFANGGGGLQSVLSPSFGFVIAFIPASALMSFIVNKLEPAGKNLLFAALIGEVVLYSIGLTYMAFILTSYLNLPQTFSSVLGIGLLPFIPGDILKIILAVYIVKQLSRIRLLQQN